MKKYLIVVSAIIGLCFFSCRSSKKQKVYDVNRLSAANLQSLINSQTDTIFLGKGIVNFDRTITLKPNTFLVGTEETVFRFDHKKHKHMFTGTNINNICFRNITIKGDRSIFPQFNSRHYSFNFNKVNNITFDNVVFEELLTSCMVYNDCKNISIVDCEFYNIGGDTKIKKSYNYDCMFFGGRSIGSHNIKVVNCDFTNIGTDKSIGTYRSDGDGIQTYSRDAMITNVIVHDCKFDRIAARGMKIQTGKKFNIYNNSFSNSKRAIGISMENDTEDIHIHDNEILDCRQGINTNSYMTNPCKSIRLKIIKNKFTNIGALMRTSGMSSILDGEITGNVIKNVESFLIQGHLTNTKIIDNTFENFQTKKAGQAGIFLTRESHGNLITDNTFKSKDNKVYDIYFYPTTKNTKVERNTYYQNEKKRKLRSLDKSKKNKL